MPKQYGTCDPPASDSQVTGITDLHNPGLLFLFRLQLFLMMHSFFFLLFLIMQIASENVLNTLAQILEDCMCVCTRISIYAYEVFLAALLPKDSSKSSKTVTRLVGTLLPLNT